MTGTLSNVCLVHSYIPSTWHRVEDQYLRGYRRAARGWGLRAWGHQSRAYEVSVYEARGFTSGFGEG